jgi:hypothetical protein
MAKQNKLDIDFTKVDTKKMCLHCVMMAAIEAKYPGWPNEDSASTATAFSDIVNTVANLGGYCLAALDPYQKMKFLHNMMEQSSDYIQAREILDSEDSTDLGTRH